MKTRKILPFLLLAPIANGQQLVETHFGNSLANLGTSVASAGDFDGDGVVDTLAGAPGALKAELFSGATGQLLHEWFGEGEFGTTVAGLGDVNGDGRDDVAVAAPTESTSGGLWIYSGGSGALLRHVIGNAASEQFGYAICLAGDIDGDGRSEIAIGAPGDDFSITNSGSVFIYSYASNTFLRILAPQTPLETRFGKCLADAGDVDGDGIDDLLVGVPNYPNAGVARIYSGATGFVLRSFSAENNGLLFASSLASLGPIAANGHHMVAIGSPFGVIGSVSVYDAEAGTLVYTLIGTVDNLFGISIAATDNASAAGFHTLIVGAQTGKAPGSGNVGAVHLFDGATGFPLATIAGSGPSQWFGHSVAALPSRDGDAYSEIAVGAPIHGWAAGAVYIYKGEAPCGPIKNIGNGSIGTAGIKPKLEATGCLRTYQSTGFTLDATQGPQFPTTGFLFLGIGQTALPLNPLCSLQFNHLLGSPIALPITPSYGPFGVPILGSGHLSIATSIPPIGAGFELRMQLLILDNGAPFGFSSTNAVELDFLP